MTKITHRVHHFIDVPRDELLALLRGLFVDKSDEGYPRFCEVCRYRLSNHNGREMFGDQPGYAEHFTPVTFTLGRAITTRLFRPIAPERQAEAFAEAWECEVETTTKPYHFNDLRSYIIAID